MLQLESVYYICLFMYYHYYSSLLHSRFIFICISIQNFNYNTMSYRSLSRYQRQLLESGLLKFLNTLVQFLPSLLIAKILKHVDKAATARATAGVASSVGGTVGSSVGAAASAGIAGVGKAFFATRKMGLALVDREGLLLAFALYGILI